MSEFSVAGSRVVVVGAGRSGIAAARLLAGRGARVTLSEAGAGIAGSGSLANQGIDIEVGGHRADTLRGADLIVLSPGVSPRVPEIAAARGRGIPVISEVELAARWLRGRLVAVTGTKGKSTTVVVAARMLEAGGRRAVVGGNIGIALSSQVEDSKPDVVHVVEVSSFQLELT
ncbi:MAG: NAD(P)-binding protein, partial [Acidobacteria bacterium]|nr:NAD(P)-binding protein [Acidobacteriota bacterium]